MVYLQPTEYVRFGLDEETSEDLVTAASAMIDAFCRRPGLDVQQYTERLRFAPGSHTVRVSTLPLAAVAPATSALVSVRVRLARARRDAFLDPLQQAVEAFALPGTWTDIDASLTDISSAGEITVPPHALGALFDEAEIIYTAGWQELPDAVKIACAQIVRNAQSTPALNVKRTTVDGMQMEYFSGALLDETVRSLLKPYMATRLG